MRSRILFLALSLAACPLACGDADSGGPAPATDSGSDAADSSIDSSKPDTDVDSTTPDTTVDTSDSSETAETASESGADSTSESGGDATGDGDGGASVDSIKCGTSTCDTTAQMCCVDTGVTPITATCTALTSTCGDLEYDCDGPEDCLGDICCASEGGGSYCDTSCTTGDRTMCHLTTECGSGETCTSCPLGPTSYGVCLPSSAACPW